jgi:hypothetical protein
MSNLLPDNYNRKSEELFAHVSFNDLFNEEILEHLTEEDLKLISQEATQEMMQEVVCKFPLLLAKLQLLIISLGKDNLINLELASLLCRTIKRLSLFKNQNRTTKKNREELNKILQAAHEKIRELVCKQEIFPQIAKSLILALASIKNYIKLIENYQ